MGIGALASTIAAPAWGAISDRTTSRWGRRRPWMVVGVVGGGIGLLIMATAPTMLLLGVGWVLAQIAFNANQAMLNAVLPDAIPEHKRGRVSGLLGLTASVAPLAGTFLTQYTTGSAVLMFMGPYVVTVIALLLLLRAFGDTPARAESLPPMNLGWIGRTFWVSPRKHPDFAWAFASRFLVFLGKAFLLTYQVYFLTDHLGIDVVTVTTFVFVSTLITASVTVLVSIFGGWLTDVAGRRKPFVLGAALIAAAGLVTIGLSTNLTMFYVGVAVTAVGQGLYYAVDLALVAAILPSKEDVAKDMGVFQIANALPQSLAPAMAPVLLAIGGVETGNYIAMFLAAGIFCTLGAFAVLPIRGTR
jgi:MFS family permease